VKLRCDRAELVDALGRACRATAARPAVRVLGGVRLVASGASLALTATDLELTVSTSLDAHVDVDGVAVVPARALTAIVQALDGTEVEVEVADATLAIRSGDSDFRLNTLPAADFPEPPVLREPIRFDIDADAFCELAGRVLRVASTDLSRPVYTGVRLTADGGALTLVATDGYRLATAKAELQVPELDVLVPARALAEVVRLAAGRMTVELTPNLIRFAVGGSDVTARTLDGRPQDHERILALPFEHRAEIPRTTLLRAVDRAALVAERGGAVELSFGEGEVRVRARSAELGAADERVALAAEVPALRIGFNARYLREGLDLAGGDEVWLEMNDALRPVVIHGATDEFAYLVAPLRLRD
jgi:DNA polymerase-3 subunit beta